MDWVKENQIIAGTEVQYRVVAGRAYYAAYHAVNNTYTADNATFSTSGMHARLINTLKSSGSKEDRRIGYTLQACKDVRTEAEYVLGADFSSENLSEAVSYSNKILGLLLSSSSEHVSSENRT